MKIPPRSFCLLLFLLLFFRAPLFSQFVSDSSTITQSVVVDGDTIPVYNFAPVYVFGRTFKNARDKRRYDRLERYVVKVYPYAEVAGEMLRFFDDTLMSMNSEAKRKRYLKRVQQELEDEFSGELKRLTVKQGIILIKLIDRETGTTSYDLVKELRGSFSAFIWQSLARLFGSNLKLEYDPEGEDREIEEIVQMIEAGIIPYEKRERKNKK